MAHKILIVNDEEDFRLLLKTMLEREGFTVINPESGQECLKHNP